VSAERLDEGPVASATGPSSTELPTSLAPRGDAHEPLATWLRPQPSPAAGVRAVRFEFSSRGDRVPGLLLLPDEGSGPYPLVLLQHGAGGSKESDYLDAARLPWVRRGVAVASIDFPLHGERASSKLSELLIGSLADREGLRASLGAVLWSELARQAVHDLHRTLDALGPHPALDARRVAYAAFSMGAVLGALYAPTDPRLCAAALALGGAGIGPPALDPARHVARFAGRPLLLVNAVRDERVPRAAAERLHAAAAEPKQVLWFDSGHNDLPGRALKAMWEFLARELEKGRT
jgi:dienelactone hydrolase